MRDISLPEWRKYIFILFDEIKVKSSLIYDKHSAQVIGFVNLGEFNDSLRNKERSNDESKKRDVATHALGVMVCGIFTDLKFPYAHFPTTTTTADVLFTLIWEAIERLERLGFKGIALTGDGALFRKQAHLFQTLLPELA